MSFIARRSKYDPIESAVNASEIVSVADKNRDYYCPGCSCLFRYRSEASNDRPAHFFKYGKSHEASCWVPYAESVSGDVTMVDLKDFSLNHFYQAILSSKERNGEGAGTARERKQTTVQLRLTTIRNLYKFCCYYPNHFQICNGIQVKDVFVGQKTAYLYTNYVRGIRLIECKYHCYDSKTNSIYFKYPFSQREDRTTALGVRVHFDSDDLYRHVRNRVFGQTAPVLLFADWNMQDGYVCGEIKTNQQIVLLKDSRA